jgi:hypothetical protein
VKVIYYIRHLVDHAISVYGQALRGGETTESFSSFMTAHRVKFASVIKKFSCVVDRQDIVLRLYERERPRLVQGFFETLLDPRAQRGEFVVADPVVINPSLTLEEMEIMLLVNRRFAALAPRLRRRLAIRISRKLAGPSSTGNRNFILTPDELLAFKNNNANRLSYVNNFAGSGFGLDFMSDRISIGPRQQTSDRHAERRLVTLVDEMVAAEQKIWSPQYLHGFLAKLTGRIRRRAL